MDQGVLIMSGLSPERVLDSVRVITEQDRNRGSRLCKLVPDYDVDNVSEKVVRIILSYTDYVNRTVWHKG